MFVTYVIPDTELHGLIKVRRLDNGEGYNQIFKIDIIMWFGPSDQIWSIPSGAAGGSNCWHLRTVITLDFERTEFAR